MIIRAALLVILVILAIAFCIGWWRAIASEAVDPAAREKRLPSLVQSVIGFVTNFFDTLGIGSFATTSTAFKLLHAVPDERIVGTMLIGHALPIVVQAFIFLVVVQVDPIVLASLIAVSVLGSWVGAGVASRLPRRPIQIGIGVGLAGYVAPCWNDGRLSLAFWLTFVATGLHIFTSHAQAAPEFRAQLVHKIGSSFHSALSQGKGLHALYSPGPR
jgi:uncharacterized membrane protein YfcA